MVDTNIQRENILPSEKAKAYKLKYEALKHQGKKSGKSTLDQVGESARENSKKVQRFFILSDSEIANKKSNGHKKRKLLTKLLLLIQLN